MVALTGDTDLRIIPACAGFTDLLTVDTFSGEDHPRMRGVYHTETTRRVSFHGSSPHARGLPVTGGDGFEWGGIIPACAGFTVSLVSLTIWGWDHPRMRGVYPGRPSIISPFSGSSPHARGLQRLSEVVVDTVRIIPACAGFTTRCRPIPALCSDHPRMRGVY